MRAAAMRAAAMLAAAMLAAACGSSQEGSAERAPETAPGPKKHSAGGPDDELVRLTLLADTTRVAPGQELSLAARFDIAPGWHIYWQNPGESGLATEADFSAPPGFTVGALRWPGPTEFDSPGDIASYGYHELAVLSAPVTAPDQIDAGAMGGAVRFSVQASWLACRDVCVRGQGAAAIDLQVATADEPARPAHQPLFDRHAEELPRSLADLEGARASWRPDGDGRRLTIAVAGATRVEYFPASGEDLQLTGRLAIPADDAGGPARVELTYKAGAPVHAGGILAVASGGRTRYYGVDLQEDAR